jgi:hypothetical protein
MVQIKLMNIKIFLIIFVSVLGVFILSAVIGNILESNGMLTREVIGSKGATAVKIFYLVLFCVMGFSIVPLAIRFFIFMQVKIGNSELFLVQFLQAHEKGVVLGVWCMLIIGLCIAVPGSIKDGFFK